MRKSCCWSTLGEYEWVTSRECRRLSVDRYRVRVDGGRRDGGSGATADQLDG